MEDDEEAILQRALQMSIKEGAQEQAATIGQAAQPNIKDLLQDNEFLQDIAKDLGIDNIDTIIQDESKKKEEEKKKKEEEDKK